MKKYDHQFPYLWSFSIDNTGNNQHGCDTGNDNDNREKRVAHRRILSENSACPEPLLPSDPSTLNVPLHLRKTTIERLVDTCREFLTHLVTNGDNLPEDESANILREFEDDGGFLKSLILQKELAAALLHRKKASYKNEMSSLCIHLKRKDIPDWVRRNTPPGIVFGGSSHHM